MEMKKQKSYRPWDTSSWDFDDSFEKYSDGEDEEESKFSLYKPTLPPQKKKVGAVKMEGDTKLTSP